MGGSLQLEFVAPGARDTMNSLALVTIACLLTATQAVKMTSNVPLFDWVSTEHVLDGLSASKDELDASSFLQYVVDPDTGVDFKQWKDLDVRSLKEQGCDGSFDCSLYSEKKTFGFEGDKEDPYYVPAKQAPEVKFPAGRIPRTARCHITCDYQAGYTFAVGEYSASEGERQYGAPPSDFSTAKDGMTPGRATKAHAAHSAAASSFLETESTTEAQTEDVQDTVVISNMGSPFYCKSLCDFKEPQFCNPVRRMVVGGAGYMPVEHSCCELCEKQCAAKTIVDRFRVCYLGCRAFCPFQEE